MTKETNTASTATTTTDPRSRGVPQRSASVVFAVLVGLAALAVLLQGLWAGIFLQHDGHRDDAGSWIEVHALGGEVALALAALATAWALWRLRARRDLWLGSLALTILLVIEAYLGGLIGDDVTFAPRPHRTSPPFPGLDRELEAGGAMDHPLFPVLWRAP